MRLETEWLIDHTGKLVHKHTDRVTNLEAQTQRGTSCKYSRVGVAARRSQIKGVGGCGSGKKS